MRAPRLVSCLLAMVALIGLTGGLGRHLGNQPLGGWLPGAVAMKEVTGALFVAAALLAYLVTRQASAPGRLALGSGVVGSVTLLWLLVATCQQLLLLENVRSAPSASAYPSLFTLAGFVAAQCATLILTLRGPEWVAGALAGCVAAIGGGGLIGYAAQGLGASWGHWLYYWWPGRVTAMAINTASAFLLLGIALAALARSPRRGAPRGLRASIQEISLEHLAIAASFVFATWTLAFNSFSYAPGMVQAITLLAPVGIDPETAFAVPLYASIGLQVVGLRRRHFPLRAAGCLLAASVYFALILSTARSNPFGVGIPLYAIIFSGYIILAIQLAAYQAPELRE